MTAHAGEGMEQGKHSSMQMRVQTCTTTSEISMVGSQSLMFVTTKMSLKYLMLHMDSDPKTVNALLFSTVLICI